MPTYGLSVARAWEGGAEPNETVGEHRGVNEEHDVWNEFSK